MYSRSVRLHPQNKKLANKYSSLLNNNFSFKFLIFISISSLFIIFLIFLYKLQKFIYISGDIIKKLSGIIYLGRCIEDTYILFFCTFGIFKLTGKDHPSNLVEITMSYCVFELVIYSSNRSLTLPLL